MSNQTDNNETLRNELRDQAVRLLGSLARQRANDLNLEPWQRGNANHLEALVSEVLDLASETLRRHGVDGELEWNSRNWGRDQSDGRWGNWDEDANQLTLWSRSEWHRHPDNADNLRVGESTDNR